ncbi:hypothetical protein OV760_27370, partial [Salmonella enterica subsp. enterica serovar 1,4,[5],12:i:-]|nr:hypothetical protein [Salmonella enterica subsp. enterica serovar 1,4,[5],12:i:-]
KEKKVQGAEAAQLVSALSNAARLPTKQYMEAFFEMVKENENENRLNTSATLSFGDLVRKAYVDKKEMHSRYPVHMYGPTNQQHEAALDKYIKYLDAKLHKAIQEGDSPKAQTYITALGFIAHPTILASFEPYLEGQKPASNYQRFVMIASLDKMTKAEPKRAQAVLYRIY